MKKILYLLLVLIVTSCVTSEPVFDMNEYLLKTVSKNSIEHSLYLKVDRIESYINDNYSSQEIVEILPDKITSAIQYDDGRVEGLKNIHIADNKIIVTYFRKKDLKETVVNTYFLENDQVITKKSKSFDSFSENFGYNYFQDDYFYENGKIQTIKSSKLEKKNNTKILLMTKQYIYDGNNVSKIVYDNNNQYEEDITITDDGYIATPCYDAYFSKYGGPIYEKKVHTEKKQGKYTIIRDDYYKKGEIVKYHSEKWEGDKLIEKIYQTPRGEYKYIYFYKE